MGSYCADGTKNCAWSYKDPKPPEVASGENLWCVTDGIDKRYGKRPGDFDPEQNVWNAVHGVSEAATGKTLEAASPQDKEPPNQDNDESAYSEGPPRVYVITFKNRPLDRLAVRDVDALNYQTSAFQTITHACLDIYGPVLQLNMFLVLCINFRSRENDPL